MAVNDNRAAYNRKGGYREQYPPCRNRQALPCAGFFYAPIISRMKISLYHIAHISGYHIARMAYKLLNCLINEFLGVIMRM